MLALSGRVFQDADSLSSVAGVFGCFARVGAQRGSRIYGYSSNRSDRFIVGTVSKRLSTDARNVLYVLYVLYMGLAGLFKR